MFSRFFKVPLFSESYLDGFFSNAEKGDSLAASKIIDSARKGNAHALALYGALCERGLVPNRGLQDALKYYLMAAKKGSPLAMNNCGCMYLDGTGVKKDLSKAYEFLDSAVTLGFFQAEFNYGVLLEEISKTVNCKDPARYLKRAHHYYRSCYKQGHPEAMVKYATFYLEGAPQFGIEKNPPKGLSIMRRAARDSAYALRCLASVYETGEHLPLNYERAFEYWREAAERGDAYAKFAVSRCYKNGLGVKADSNQARFWLERSAKGNCQEAILALSEEHASGEYGTADKAESVRMMKKAAEAKTPEAFVKLAQYELENPIGRVSYENAYGYYSQAAELGNDDARFETAVLCLGKLERAEEGIKILEYGAKQFLPRFLNRLAREYEKGVAVDGDYEKARLLYGQAADGNYAPAFFNLAKMYQFGIGVEKSDDEASEFYGSASALGCPDADLELAKIYIKGGDPDSLHDAAEILESAIEAGVYGACAWLGYMHENGLGNESDYGKAMELYMAAYTNSDCAFSAYRLSRLYSLGLECEKDEHKAFAFLRFAANKKNLDAMKELVKRYKEGFPSSSNIEKADILAREIENYGDGPDANFRLD